MKLSTLKTRLVICVSVLVLALCMAYLFRQFQWGEALEIVAQANVKVFLFGAVVSITTFWIFRTLRWSVMLAIFGYKDISFKSLSIGTAYTLGLSGIIPMQSGEIIKVEMLKKSAGLSRTDGYFALAIERLLDMTVVLLAAMIFISISTFKGETVTSAVFVMSLLLLGALSVYLGFHFFAEKISIVQKVKARLAILLSNPALVLKAILYTVMAWICVILGWWTSFLSVQITLDTIDVVGITTGMTLVNVASFVPGSVGVSEVGISVWLHYLGFSVALANAGALMLRAYGMMVMAMGVLHWLVVQAFLFVKADE